MCGDTVVKCPPLKSMLSVKRQFALSLALLLGLSMLQATATGKQISKSERTRQTAEWNVNEGEKLEAKVVSDSESLSGDLKVFKGSNLLFKHRMGLFPDSMFVLDDGNLVTLWTHGNGATTLHVLGYSHGKVRTVLETFCGKLRPEFVYQNAAHIMGEASVDENGKSHIRGGPFYQQRIIVPTTDWVEVKKPYLGFGKSDYLPTSADIYTWDEQHEKYNVRKNIPWQSRLNNL